MFHKITKTLFGILLISVYLQNANGSKLRAERSQLGTTLKNFLLKFVLPRMTSIEIPVADISARVYQSRLKVAAKNIKVTNFDKANILELEATKNNIHNMTATWDTLIIKGKYEIQVTISDKIPNPDTYTGNFKITASHIFLSLATDYDFKPPLKVTIKDNDNARVKLYVKNVRLEADDMPSQLLQLVESTAVNLINRGSENFVKRFRSSLIKVANFYLIPGNLPILNFLSSVVRANN